MAFDDINLPIVVKTDTAELRRLIKEFDGSTEAAERLARATDQVKESTNQQRKAIAAYNSATRTQNFQLIESLRLVNSMSFLFRNLNQVYQTLILKQIQSKQASVAESEAFEKLSRNANSVVNALDILGPANEEVNDALSDLVATAGNLSSENLETLIDRLNRAGQAADFSTEEQAKFNATMEKLSQVLGETKIAEKNQELQDLFGTIVTAGAAAGSLGQFVLQLSKFKGVMELFAPGTKAGLGVAAIVGLLSVPAVIEALGIERNTESPITGQPLNIQSLDEIIERIRKPAELAQRKIEFHINNPNFDSSLDINKTIDILRAKMLEEQGFGSLG